MLKKRSLVTVAREIDTTMARLETLRAEALTLLHAMGPIAAGASIARALETAQAPRKRRRKLDPAKETERRRKMREAWDRRKRAKAEAQVQTATLQELGERLSTEAH